jgi:hypothetical protein
MMGDSSQIITSTDCEAGSLLEQALKREDALENALVVDVFHLIAASSSTSSDNSVDNLLALAETAVALNQFIQSHKYPWISGGDGPVFGIHTTTATTTNKKNAVPHLRTVCYYDVSVADEWMLVGLVLEYSRQNEKIAVSCWDRDDGQFLLVQSALVLPEWVETIGPQQCRHRCWIQRGGIYLIQPTSENEGQEVEMTLEGALEMLYNNRASLDSKITSVILETVSRIQSAPRYHKTALAVPRVVATLAKHRPDLIAAACNSFQNMLETQQPLPDVMPLDGMCQDWIVITHELGRTHYAMLRSIVGPPHWPMEDSIPTIYNSVEVKRLKRTTMASPHLHHAVPLGVRIVAGLDCLLRSDKGKSARNFNDSSLMEQRVLTYWRQVDLACQRDGTWLQEAWLAGPNNATHSLDNVCKCPVYKDELTEDASLTPLSHPESSISEQIRRELQRKDQLANDVALPSPQEVDSEDWMAFPDDEELTKASAPVTASDTHHLDDLLGGVETFMKGKSDVDGVASQQSDGISQLPSTTIDPTIFLNILHMVLKAKSADEIHLPSAATDEDDLFFSAEDYEMGDDDAEADQEMLDVMDAMDRELKGKTVGDDIHVDHVDEDVAESVHVLGNLLKSLDSQGGASGPVANILGELGLGTPQLSSDE